MKLLILAFFMIFTLKAPYDPDFYIRGKKVNRAFFIKHYKHSNTFLRIRVKSCLVDTLHVQPERSKREDSQSREMRCSEHCGNTVRKVQ